MSKVWMLPLVTLVFIGAGCTPVSKVPEVKSAQDAVGVDQVVTRVDAGTFTLTVDNPDYQFDSDTHTVYGNVGKGEFNNDFSIKWHTYNTDQAPSSILKDYCRSAQTTISLGGHTVQYCPKGQFNAEEFGGPAYYLDGAEATFIYVDADVNNKVVMDAVQTILQTLKWKPL